MVRLGLGAGLVLRPHSAGYVDPVAATCCFLVTLELTSP
jgi:hypothetical protein